MLVTEVKVAEVVPLAGTWIETVSTISHSVIVCVVPVAGTWIETAYGYEEGAVKDVVPLAGTWIETVIDCQYTFYSRRSPRGNVD